MNDIDGFGENCSGQGFRQKKDPFYEGENDRHNDFSLPDYTGALKAARKPRSPRQDAPFGQSITDEPAVPPINGTGTRTAGTAVSRPLYPSGIGAGLQAFADTTEQEHDPDNQLSSRLFQAGKHDAIASSLSDESDPANAPSVRLMQSMRHDVAEKTFGRQYGLDNQPTSSLFRNMRGSGTDVSGAGAVADTHAETFRMPQWEKEKGPDYARSFFAALGQSALRDLSPSHQAQIFEQAGERPDRFTETPPLVQSRLAADRIEDWARQIEDDNRKAEQAFSFREEEARKLHEMKEEMSKLSGSVVEPAIMIAVSRKLPGNTIYWGVHEWNRLANRIHRQVRDQTGNDLLAESIATGAIAAMAEYFVPQGLFPNRYAPDFGEIAATVGAVLDGLLAGYVGEQVAEWEADRLGENNQ